MTTLQLVWFGLLGVLLAGYAVLDGFDLGVGTLHLLARGDHERRSLLNAIGPVWDGNEVWLVVFGGALFAAFPNAYASVFSAFYLPLMFLLFALVLRAVAIEFRSKQESRRWRATWDVIFFAASSSSAGSPCRCSLCTARTICCSRPKASCTRAFGAGYGRRRDASSCSTS